MDKLPTEGEKSSLVSRTRLGLLVFGFSVLAGAALLVCTAAGTYVAESNKVLSLASALESGLSVIEPVQNTVETVTPVAVIAPQPPAVSFDMDTQMVDVHKIYVKASAGSKANLTMRGVSVSLEKSVPQIAADATNHKWQFQMKVGDLPVGEYRFVSRITVDSVVFEQQSDIVKVVKPAPVSQPATTDTPEASGEDAAVMPVGEPTLTFSGIPSTAVGILPVKIISDTITGTISLVTRNTSGKIMSDLKPQSTSGATRTYSIDTKVLPDATYTLEARFKWEDKDRTIPGPQIYVKNGQPQTSSSTPAVTTVAAAGATTTPFVPATIRLTKVDGKYTMFEFSVTGAQAFEVYTTLLPQTTQKFHGQAKQTNPSLWNYTIDTSLLPTGSYQISGKYKVNGTSYSVVGPTFSVAAPVVETEKKPEEVAKEKEIAESVAIIEPIVTEVQKEILPAPAQKPLPNPVVSNPVSGTSTTTVTAPRPLLPPPAPINMPLAQELVTKNRDTIDQYVHRYTTALRGTDRGAIERTKNELLELSQELVATGEGVQGEEGFEIQAEVDAHIKDLESRAVTADKIVRERTNDAIAKDTDKDGITDFDEVALYKSDPKLADTDNDGFTDGAEILAGYNPVDAKNETAYNLESPKDSGIVRDDVLVVDEVKAVNEEVAVADGVPAQAQISGRALPNSFVTLYVFSTPVVVTLKTADDGSWVYKFDKELEDGEHEVYVGITDNAGTLVAKSNPFTFVKEAQAFTPTDALEEVIPEANASASTFELPLVQLLILAVIAMLIGLILIMLGRQLDTLQKRNIP